LGKQIKKRGEEKTGKITVSRGTELSEKGHVDSRKVYRILKGKTLESMCEERQGAKRHREKWHLLGDGCRERKERTLGGGIGEKTLDRRMGEEGGPDP